MREILFRGKTVGGDKWVCGSLIRYGRYCCILQEEGAMHPMDEPYLDPELGIIDGAATPVEPETVGQFTGLTDTRGVRIFEDDIVDTVYDCGYGGVAKERMGRRVVTWHRDSFMKKPVGGAGFFYFSACDKETVIGNIFDRPDLLITP